MSDLLDASVFLETEDGRMMHRKGVSPDIPRKLYRGEWPVEAAIDLSTACASTRSCEAVARFILENHMSGAAACASFTAWATAARARAFCATWSAAGSSSVPR